MQKVWGEGATAEQYYRGSLCPKMAKQIYYFPSKMRMCNSELTEEIRIANGDAHKSREAPKVERHHIPECCEEAIANYKASVRFKKGLKRMRVTSY
ncbi:hypothetical protein BHM03_00014593 [Ensete ventricosum]|nr:hypothetical protein BHM03_00014593 [Ensete ventricosum]